MVAPFTGLWIWIWELPQCDGGDLDAIANRCSAAGIAGVIVKAADGGRWFPQGRPVTEIVAGLRKRGIGVATWDYCYLSEPGAIYYGYQVAGWREEAQRAIETITQAQPDFHVLDVEAESEGRAAVATSLLQQLQAGIPAGFPLAYAPLPSIRNHLALPYRQFTDAGLVMLPQLYWTGLQWTVEKTVSEFYTDAAQYDLLSRPVYPAYEDAPGDRPSDADMATFASLLRTAGADGASVWSYQHLDAGAWKRLELLAALLEGTKPEKPPFGLPERLQLISYVANGSGVRDITDWVNQYSEG